MINVSHFLIAPPLYLKGNFSFSKSTYITVLLLKIIADICFRVLICVTVSYNDFSGFKVHFVITTDTLVIGETRLSVLLMDTCDW